MNIMLVISPKAYLAILSKQEDQLDLFKNKNTVTEKKV